MCLFDMDIDMLIPSYIYACVEHGVPGDTRNERIITILESGTSCTYIFYTLIITMVGNLDAY